MKKYPKYSLIKLNGIDEVPEHWIIGKTRRLLNILTDFTSNGSFADLAKNVKYRDIPDHSRLIRLTDLREDLRNEGIYVTKEAHEYLSKSELFGGEILMANVGAYAGLVCVVPNLNFVATLGPNMFLLKFDEKKISNKYAFVLLGSDYYYKLLMNKALSSAQPKLNKEDIKSVNLIFPPAFTEQNAIVRFLDYKTRQIDRFIINRKKQIELLKEQRDSIIDKVVLCGLNNKASMKVYDNIFIKKLPKNWKLSSVRREIMSQNIEQQDGNHGELHPVATDYVDNGIPFVLASDVNNFTVDLERCKKIPVIIAKKLRIGFSKTGDILLTHKGTIGRVGICDTKEYPYIILTPQVTYYRVKRDFLPKFIFYQFQSNVFKEQLKLLSGGGSTRDYVGIVAQRELKLIKPPIDEQIDIVNHIDIETGKLDTLISKYQKQIDLMQEYRASLISQAVTGKIDVREWQPKNKK